MPAAQQNAAVKWHDRKSEPLSTVHADGSFRVCRRGLRQQPLRRPLRRRARPVHAVGASIPEVRGSVPGLALEMSFRAGWALSLLL